MFESDMVVTVFFVDGDSSTFRASKVQGDQLMGYKLTRPPMCRPLGSDDELDGDVDYFELDKAYCVFSQNIKYVRVDGDTDDFNINSKSERDGDPSGGEP